MHQCHADHLQELVMTRFSTFLVSLAGAAAGVILPAASASAESPPTKLSNPGSYVISANLNLAGAADGLATQLGGALHRRTVDWVLDHANRPLAPLCHTGSGDALFPLTRGTGELGFCWSQDDPTSDAWIPQGITTTADALGERAYDGRQAVVTTWYNATEHSTRLSIAPATGYLAGIDYRHLLLVTPQPGPLVNFTTVDCHAGGALWYGHLLYVACTNHIKIFDWNDVYSTDTTAFCANRVGKFVDGTTTRFCASGYAYLMMQVGTITNPSGNVRFSSISLDRASTPDKLVVSEYSSSAGGKLVRFNLDFQTRLPAATTATDVYSMPFTLVQGATSRDAKFWFHSSGGVIQPGEGPDDNYGKLRFWDSSTGRFVSYTSAYGAEALSYWGWGDGDGGLPDLLYTLTEHAGYRAVIAVRQSDFN
jgi:hypothetical protein